MCVCLCKKREEIKQMQQFHRSANKVARSSKKENVSSLIICNFVYIPYYFVFLCYISMYISLQHENSTV